MCFPTTLRIPAHSGCGRPNLSLLHTTIYTSTKDPPEKWGVRLSRTLKVIGTDKNRSATYDFLLVIHSNHGPISYRIRDKRRFGLKSQTSVFLTASLRGFPLDFFDGDGAGKTRLMPLADIHLFRHNTSFPQTEMVKQYPPLHVSACRRTIKKNNKKLEIN